MELPKPPSNLTTLASFFFLLFFTTILQTFSAGGRRLSPPPPQPRSGHKTMTFYMPNYALNSKPQHPPKTTPTNNNVNKAQPILPFSKPIGLFPPVGGIPVSDYNSFPNQAFSLHGTSLSALNILQEELEFGMVYVIDVPLFEKTNLFGLTLLGKAKGMYVGSKESQMMAMTTSFADSDYKDGLRFFGVHQADVASESHVAIIGGTGIYEGANGYATINWVKLSSKFVKEGESNNFLLIDVYLG